MAPEDIKRYEPGWDGDDPVEMDDGQFVLYEDHERVVRELEAKITRLDDWWNRYQAWRMEAFRGS